MTFYHTQTKLYKIIFWLKCVAVARSILASWWILMLASIPCCHFESWEAFSKCLLLHTQFFDCFDCEHCLLHFRYFKCLAQKYAIWNTLTVSFCVAYLVIRDLLQVQMGGVDHLHAGVAVVSAAESAPVFGVRVERVCLLSAALQRNRQWLSRFCWWRATCVPCARCDIYNCGRVSLVALRWLTRLWLEGEARPALLNATSETT